MAKKRVWCLYRVSGKKQVSTEDDIPMQRNACREFVNSKPDWEITNELYEKGVSGWKLKAEDRDEMNEIKEAAINKKFDVLLVFLYDRLGRREDETPVVLQFLLKQGIEVWSVNEGQRKIESHIDKLLNYISFWQSDGESQKTSIRARESKKQLSEQGYFQGGIAPVGYKIVETDRPHWKVKDRFEKELAIDEEEAELVRLVFSLYIEKHMGYRKIVDYLTLNGYRTREGKIFGVPTINRMLHNPVYIGKKRYKGYDGEEGDTQPYNEKLRIISDDTFNLAQQIRNNRREKLHDQEKSGIPLAGKLMFSGIAYCKYCGSKLSSNYLYRKQKYKDKEDYYTNTVYRYRCPLNKGKHNCNHEQNIWGSKKYDRIIIKQVKTILSQLELETFIDTSVNHKRSQIDLKQRNVANLEKEINSHKKQLATLNGEIANALLGVSKFTSEQLSAAINTIEEKMNSAIETVETLKREIEKEKDDYSDVNFVANELQNWESKFDNADSDLKKAMLSRIIDKVYLGKDEVEIVFNLSLQECLQQMV